MAERLALPTSDHGVAGSNPAGGEILPEPKRRFIAQSLSCSPFHRLEMTEILLKGRKTLTDPSIYIQNTRELCKIPNHRVKNNEKPITSLSPFVIEKQIEALIGTPNSVKKMRNQTLLVETTRKIQTEQLLKCKTFFNLSIEVSEQVASHFVPRSFRTHFGHFVPTVWSFRTQ